MQKLGGEEGTAGSDQKVRYSSGGPISLDPVRTILITIFAIILRISSALVGDEWGGVGGGGDEWGGVGGGGGWGEGAIHDIIQ